MLIKILLTFFFFFFLIYSFLLFRSSRLLSLIVAILAPIAAFLVWMPEKATMIANTLGVGRGADLLLYLWFLLSALLILLLHLKLKSYHQELTELARYIAISFAKPPKPGK
ncbi:MAG: DUF2304 family protein [Methylobacter sp.]|nr:DUF2304 family protein [Methylobacter sp.]